MERLQACADCMYSIAYCTVCDSRARRVLTAGVPVAGVPPALEPVGLVRSEHCQRRRRPGPSSGCT